MIPFCGGADRLRWQVPGLRADFPPPRVIFDVSVRFSKQERLSSLIWGMFICTFSAFILCRF